MHRQPARPVERRCRTQRDESARERPHLVVDVDGTPITIDAQSAPGLTPDELVAEARGHRRPRSSSTSSAFGRPPGTRRRPSVPCPPARPKRRNDRRVPDRLAYPRRTVRLVEIRLFEGPNVYRLVPVVKVEVAVGPRRGRGRARGRRPAARSSTSAGPFPPRDWPDDVTDLVAWTRRLRAEHDETGGPVIVHHASDAGRWLVTWPWSGAERSRLIADASFDLASRSVAPRAPRPPHRDPAAGPRHAGTERIAAARATPPSWIRDAERSMPIVSITGTNGKSTVTRLITHILLRGGAPRRDDHLGRDPRRRADGRRRRLDRARRRGQRSSTGPTSTSPSSRRPVAGSSSRAWATSRTRRACSPTSRRTTSTSRGSTRSRSSRRSSRRSAG